MANQQLQGGLPLPSEEYVVKAMPSLLTTLDMTALYLVVIFFIVNAVSATTAGPAGFTYWILCGITFFVPCVIATAQLAAMFPYEGSLYNWTHKALGGYWSFFIGFCAWFPGILVMISGADAVVTCIQAMNPTRNLLSEPWQQGVVIIAFILFSVVFCLQRFRVVQNVVNCIIGLTMLSTVIIVLAGFVWLLSGHQSATNFGDAAQWRISWSPSTTNISLFGTITLAYLGTEVPLNMGGEISNRKVITRHLLWGTLIVLAAYLLVTFSLLTVEGTNAAMTATNPAVLLIATVEKAFGTNPFGELLANITILGITGFFIIVPIVYNLAFARLLLVAGIDARLPKGIGRLNKYRVPANAIIFQGVVTILLTAIIFFVVPYVATLGNPAALANEVYFVMQAATTLVWAVSCTFFFVNLGIFYFRDKRAFRLQRIFPMPVLVVTSIVGPIACLAAIVDTLSNSWISSQIGNGQWWYIVGGLTLFCLVIAMIGSMYATNQASWEKIELSVRPNPDVS